MSANANENTKPTQPATYPNSGKLAITEEERAAIDKKLHDDLGKAKITGPERAVPGEIPFALSKAQKEYYNKVILEELHSLLQGEGLWPREDIVIRMEAWGFTHNDMLPTIRITYWDVLPPRKATGNPGGPYLTYAEVINEFANHHGYHSQFYKVEKPLPKYGRGVWDGFGDGTGETWRPSCWSADV